MKLYTTKIMAIDPRDGILKSWCGPNVPGISFSDAELYCQNNGLGYCQVDGELIAEIPCKPGTYEPDMSNIVNYDLSQN